MKSEDLDEIDKEILHLLFQDGRMSLTDLGEKIIEVNGTTLSHVAIRNRLQKIIPTLIKIQANLHLKNINLHSVFLLIETKDYDTQRKMIEKSRLCPRIGSLEVLSGKFNLLIRVIGTEMSDIDCFISCVIQSDDMIRNYQVLHSREQIKPKYFPIKFPANRDTRELRTPCGQNCGFCAMYKDNLCSGCPGSSYAKYRYKELRQSSK